MPDAGRDAGAPTHAERGERAPSVPPTVSGDAYRTLLENIPDLIVRYDASLQRIYVNPAWEAASGLRSADVVGDYPGRLPGVAQPVVPEYLAALRAVLADGEPRRVAFEWGNARGETLQLEYAIVPERSADGSVTSIIAVGRDLTEYRRAEEALRASDARYRHIVDTAEREQARLATAVEQADEAIVITDASASIVYVNPAYERITGYTRAELVGRNPRMLHSGQHGDAFYRSMWAELAAGRTWRGTLHNRRKDGSVSEEDSIITPIVDGTGAVVNYVGVQRDVTEVRALEAQLRQAQKMEAIGQLAGGIAHDFNNLLTAIIGYTDLIRAALPEAAEAHADLDEVVLAANRAAELTRQLLAFGRRLPRLPQIVSPAEVVDSLAPMLRRLLGEHIELATRAGAGVPNVRVDRSQLEQVIVNLAVNARDAMPAGGRLSIETSRRPGGPPNLPTGAAAERWAAITVADTGMGMSDDARAHAFEPFFTTKGPGQGSGLGLATVYGIVSAAGGSVELETVPAIGTTFTILLPAVDAPADEPAALPQRRLARGAETVLLVEDDDAVRAFAARTLEGLGYRVLTAADGVDALAVAGACEDAIDLAVTDLVMPRMGGRELVDRLHSLRPRLRALLVSGFVSDDAEAGPAVPFGFLPKPYTAEQLARAVRAAIEAAD